MVKKNSTPTLPKNIFYKRSLSQYNRDLSLPTYKFQDLLTTFFEIDFIASGIMKIGKTNERDRNVYNCKICKRFRPKGIKI